MASRSSFPALRASPVNVVQRLLLLAAVNHQWRATFHPDEAYSFATRGERSGKITPRSKATITTVRYQPHVCRLKIVSVAFYRFRCGGIGRTQVCQQDPVLV